MSVSQLNKADVIREANQILADFGLERSAPVSSEPEPADFDSTEYRRLTESDGQVRAGLFGRPQFRGQDQIDVPRLCATLANVEPAVAVSVIQALPHDIACQVLAGGTNSVEI